MFKLILGLLAIAVAILVTGYTPSLKKSGAFVSVGILFIFVGATLGQLFGRSALDVVLLHERNYLTLATPAVGYILVILGLVGIFKSKFVTTKSQPHKIDK